MDRRKRAPHRDRRLVFRGSELELLQAREGLDERRAVALTRSETERRRSVGDRELHRVGGALEPVGEMAHQQQRGGPERREPERLRVPGAGIVPEHVEHGVGPGSDAESSGHERSSSIARLAAGEGHLRASQDV